MLPPIVDDTLLDSIRQVESAGNPNAVSRVGAKGAYQLMDPTGLEWHGILKITEKYNPFDELQSRQIAKAYLERLFEQFKKPELAVAAYNCGPGRLYRAIKQSQCYDWKGVMSYCPGESRDYVRKVEDEYARRRIKGDADKLGWIEGIIERFKSEGDFIQPGSNVDVGLPGSTSEKNMEWLKKLIAGNVAKSVVRKLMVLLSGVLLGIGIDPSVVNQFTSSGTEVLIAVVLYAIAQGWSLLEKKAAAK